MSTTSSSKATTATETTDFVRQPEQLTPFGYALAGALGGVFSNAVVYPLDTVKTRIQAAKKRKGEKQSVLSLLVRILKEEGVSSFYNGFGASMLNTFSMQYAYFFFYSIVRGWYKKRLLGALPKGSKVPQISTGMELLLGAVAGALGQIFTIPVSVIATRQQIGLSRISQKATPAPTSPSDVSPSKPSYADVADPKSSAASSSQMHAEDNSFFGVANTIIREDGITGLWLGLKPSLVLTVNPAITYGVFERVKGLLLLAKETSGGEAKLTPWQAFFVGALSKTLATVVTYPYIMAKVRIQAGHSTDDEEEESLPGPSSKPMTKRKKDVGAVTLLSKVLKEQGFTGWYQGMGAQITKAVLSQALLFMSKDQFEQYALVIMGLQRRMMRTSA